MSIAKQLKGYLTRILNEPDDRESLVAVANLIEDEETADRVLQTAKDRFAKSEDWTGLLTFYSNLSKLVTEPRFVAKILLATGRLLETDPSRHQEAIQIYNEAFLANRQDAAPLRAARELYRLYEQWDAVHQMLVQESKIESSPAILADLWAELGDIRFRHYGDREGAQEAYQRALDYQAKHPRALEGLALVSPEAAQVLAEVEVEPLEEITAEYPAEPEAHERVEPLEEITAEYPAEPEAHERVEPLEETAPVEQGEPPETAEGEAAQVPPSAAPVTEEEARRAEPTPPARKEMAEEIGVEEVEPEREAHEEAEEEPEPTEAVETETAELPAVSEEETCEYWIERAQSVRGEEAAAAYLNALTVMPTSRERRQVKEVTALLFDADPDIDRWMAELRPRLLLDREAWEGILECLVERYEGQPDESMRRAMYQVSFYHLQDYQRAVSLAGTEVADDENLVNLANMGNWRKVQLQLAADATKAGLANPEHVASIQAANIALGLGKVEKAIDSLRHLFRSQDLDRPYRELLKAMYQDKQKWQPLLDVLKKEVDSAESDEDKIALMREMVRIYRDHLNRNDMVVKTYQSILKVRPEDTESLEELSAKLEEMRNYPALVDVLRRRAECGESIEAKTVLLLQIADVYVNKFSNQAEAIRAYEAVLEVDPDCLFAIQYLSKMYRQRGDWKRLVDIERTYVDQLEDVEEKANTLAEIATVAFDRLRNPDLAEELWQEVLAINPEDDRALEALSKVYERQKNWGELASILEQRMGSVSGDEQKRLLEKLGGILADRLHDRERAVVAFESLLELEPDNRRAVDALRKSYIELNWWDRLEEFYARQEAWPEYLRTLETLAGQQRDPEVGIDLLFRATRIWLDRMDDVNRAVRALERIRGIEPDHREAALQLAEFYEAAGNHRKLRDVLDVLLKGEEDPSARFELLLKLARLNETLRDVAVGFGLYCEAVETQPDRVDILDEVELLAREVDRWRDLEATYRRAVAKAQQAQDFETAEVLSLRLGRVLDEELGRDDQALDCFVEVLENNPDSLPAIDALIGIYQHQGDNDALLDMYHRRLDVTQSGDERVQILAEMAGVYELGLGDVSNALQRHLMILDLVSPEHPAHRTSLAALHRLYRQEEDWNALAQIIGREIEGADPQDDGTLLALHSDLGQVCLHQLGDIKRALSSYRDVLRRDPNNEVARVDLESLLDDPLNALEACTILEPIYQNEENWAALVRVLDIRYRHLTSEGGAVEERKALLGRIEDIQANRRQDMRAALEAVTQMLALTPEDEEVRQRLEHYAATIPAWADLAEVLSDRLMGLVEPGVGEAQQELAASYAFRLAQVCDTRLDQPQRAIDYYRQTLELTPQHRPALDALADLYTRSAMWPELLEVQRRQIELSTDPGEIRSLRFKIAALHEDLLGEPMEAISTYLQVLADDPQDTEALQALNRLYETEGQYPELAGNIQRQIELCQPGSPEWCSLMCRLADIEERQLNDTLHAVSLYREVLETRTEEEQAMRSLERLLEEPQVAYEVSRILSPLYEASGDTTQLIASLKTELTYTDDPSERLSLYHRIADLYETGLMAPSQAFATLLEAVVEAPHESTTLNSLYRLADQEGVWPQLAVKLDELATGLDDSLQASSLYVRLAKIAEQQLGDPQRSADYWRAVLERNPGDRDAIFALERLYRYLLQDWNQLVEVLLMKADLPEVVEDPKQRNEVFVQAATLYEDMLFEKDKAIEMLERVVEIDAQDEHALRELDRLYQQTEQFTDLIDNCHRRLFLAQTDSQRCQIWYQMGQVYETKLDDPDRAIGVYLEILDVSGQEGQALKALERLYRQTENWPRLLENLEQQRGLAQSLEDVRELRYQAARLSQTRLFDLEQAIDIYAEILSEDSTYHPAVNALEEMLQQGEEMAKVAQVLGPLYEDSQEWRKLIGMYELLVHEEADPQLRADSYRRIADIYETQLHDPAGTFDALQVALREIPSEEVFASRLEQLAATLQRWGDLVALLESLRDEVADLTVRVALGKRCGRILETEMGDVEGAIQAYHSVLEIDPQDAQTLEALDLLYQQAARWPDLSEIIEKRIHLAESDEESLALRYRLGTLYETLLDSPARAVDTFNDVLTIAPGNAEAIGSLERMFEAGNQPHEIAPILEPYYREQEDWKRLVDLKLKMVDFQDTASERFDTLCDAGQIAISRRDDEATALVIYGNALCERPGDEPTLERIEELADKLGQHHELAQIYHAALSRDLDDFDAQRLSLKLAGTLHDKLGDVQGALGWYQHALQFDETSLQALQALDSIYTTLQLWPELASVLRREREQSMDEAEVVLLSYRLAELYERYLNDPDEAIAAYNHVLEVDPTHVESLAALENIYKMRGDWEALYSVYERQANLAETDEQRAVIYRSMAELAMSGLDRLDEAIDLWLRVRVICPDDEDALTSLEFLYEQTERYDELVEVLERRADLTEEPQDRVTIYEKIGRVWRMLGNDERAIAAYQTLLDLSPGHREALFALRELYEATANSEPLCGVLAQMISGALLDQQGLVEAYQRLGELYGDVLGKYEEAIQAWSFVLQLKPGDEQALDQLERFYLEGEHWQDAIVVLEQKMTRTQDSAEQIDYLFRIAELWQGKIQDLDQAAMVFERLLQLEPESDTALNALENIYEEQENWDPLADLFLRRYETLTERFDRLEVLRKAADVYEQKKDEPESAFLVMLRAFQEDPLDMETSNQLEVLAEKTGEWGHVVAMYTNTISQVAASHGEQATLELHQRLAGYYREKLDRAEMAQVHYLKALEIDPGNEIALSALESLYQQSSAWQELVAILKRRLDLPVDDSQQIELYLKIGRIEKDQVGNIDEAIYAYKMVLRLDEQNLDALLALENIYEQRGDWRELIEVLEQRVGVIYEPEKVIELKYKVGSLWQNQLQVPERAIDVYRDILMIDPAFTPAMDTLDTLYVNLEKWDRYLDLLDMRLALEPPPEQQVEILVTKARVHKSEFGENEQAVDCYRKVLELQPGRIDVIRELQTIDIELEYWDELCSMLAGQVEHIREPSLRIELLSLEGQVAEERLDDSMRAIDRYQRVLELDPDHRVALNALSSLYTEVGQWEEAIEVYNRLIMKSDEVSARTELLCRVAQIYEQNILDDEAALERLQTALDLEPACTSAMHGLRHLYEKQEDWEQSIQMVQREVDYSRDIAEKSSLLAVIGGIYEERLQDSESAMDYYQRAIDLDPHNVVAAAPLAEHFLNEKQWARAIPLLEGLIASRAYATATEGLHLLHYNAGLAAEELGQDDKALEHYRQAYEVDRTYLPILEGLARMYTKRDDPERAFEVFSNLLVQYGDQLDNAKTAEIYSQQGDIKLRVGERRAALELFEKALSLNSNDRMALEKMIDIFSKQEEWDRVVEYNHRLADLSVAEDEKFKVLVDTGDVYRDKLGRMEEAINAYKNAFRVDPNSKVVLHRLLDIFTKAEKWKRASEVLGKLAELETDPERQSKIFYTTASILREHLDDKERAITFFNRALDIDVRSLQAFQAIDTILTQDKDWQRLEHNYQKMIKRIIDQPDEELQSVKAMLWRNLGEIYRTRLNNWEDAIQAYQAAANLIPEEPAVHEILADLYERVGGHQEDAIGEHHALIQADPFRFQSYQALFNRYIEIRDFDAAWCVSGALTLLDRAADQEKEYYQKYLGSTLPYARRQLTPEQWQRIYHDEQDLALGNILAMFANFLRDTFSYDLKSTWKVHKKKDLLDLSKQILFSQLFNYAVRVLGVSSCNVYVKKDQLVGLRNANNDPPALIAGSDMLQGRDERELAFYIGKALCLMRPEHYVGSAFPVTENLKMFFFAAWAVTQPKATIPVTLTPDFERIVKEIMSRPHSLVAIQKVTQFYLDSEVNPNFSTWLKSIDFTSDRVGMLLCGDLKRAVQAVKAGEVFSISKAATKDRIKELVLYSVSQNYLALRKDLGLAIGSE